MGMKIARLNLRLPAPAMPSWRRATDFIFWVAAPLLLLIGAFFVASQVMAAQQVIWKTVIARRVETNALDTFLYAHSIKSRRLEYLLTGSDHYLSQTVEDQAKVGAGFKALERALADEAAQAAELPIFRAHVQHLFDFTGRMVDEYRAGHRDKVRAMQASQEFIDVMDDTGLGGRDLIFSERARIIALQRSRTEAFNNSLFGILALILGLAAYCAARILILSSSMRRQKRIVQALERARRQAEEARAAAESSSRAKSDFLASVSHELRTPLNAILGFSEMIGSEALGPVHNRRYREYACDIHESGRHLLTLVDNILDLTKIGAGKMELRESEFETDSLITDSIRLLGEDASRHLSLAMDLPANLPLIRGDFTLIKQILLNLLSNAAKFTPAGGRITVSARHPPGQGLCITVADTGIGMDAEDIKRAMAMFGQIDSRIARHHHGTGLGLPLSRSYAELHDGQLQVESEPGVGTRVSLLLPPSRLRRATVLFHVLDA
jgi:signal transduction histidine kinase